ncbi:MAG: hypothetical protein RI894_2153 [Bacteroidota bacterium]
MKKNLYIIFIFCMLFAPVFTPIFAQVQKTLVKSYNLNGAKVVILDLKTAVNFKTSDNAALRLETDINLKNGNLSLFQVLQTKKRYDLQVNNDGNTMRLTAIDHELVKFAGQDLQEVIVYNVFVPENVNASILKDELHTYVLFETTDAVAGR